MDERMAFAVYCIELYRARHGGNGNEIMDLFIGTGALDYVMRFYDALHVMGSEYIRGRPSACRRPLPSRSSPR